MAERIRHLNFNEKLLTGIDFVGIDHNYTQSKRNLATPHRASFYCIIWLQAGEIVHHVDFQPVALKADTYLFVPKDAIQFFDHHHVFTSRVLLFTDTFFCKNDSDYLFLKSTALFNNLRAETAAVTIKATLALKALWHNMAAEFEHQNDLYRPALLKNHLYSFMLTAEREKNREQPASALPGNQLSQAIAFKQLLELNFRQQRPVSFYAEQLSVSTKVLTGATLKTAGKSPKQLADERLILEAKRMIIYSEDSGKVIGYALGFEEPTNFIKFFKKHTGITPVAFRKKYAG